jgi:hypothetical protein
LCVVSRMLRSYWLVQRHDQLCRWQYRRHSEVNMFKTSDWNC